MMARLLSKLRSFNRDERGADMVEYILVLAAIALPLVGLMILYRNEISVWVKELWEGVRSAPDVEEP